MSKCMSSQVFFTVIFRACDRVVAVNKNPRPFGLDKTELVKICFRSLRTALQHVPHRIIVLGDNLSDNLLDFFRHQDIELQVGTFGNEASFLQALKIAETIPDHHWVYFCEDDYLHTPDAFLKIKSFIDEHPHILKQQWKVYNPSTWLNLQAKDIFIFPPDYPDRYLPKYRKHSLIVIAPHAHWRQVSHITFTFLTQSRTMKKYMKIFQRAVRGANDRYLSRKLFGRFAYGWGSDALCFSPIPGVSSHMHRDTMTPLVDWEKLIKKFRSNP